MIRLRRPALAWMTGCAMAVALGIAAGEPTPSDDTSPTVPENVAAYWQMKLPQFVAENATLPAGRRNLLLVGDSLAEAFPLAQLPPDVPVVKRGISGDGVVNLPGNPIRWGLLQRMTETFHDTNPGAVMLMIGINHMLDDEPTQDELEAGFRSVIREVRERHPDAPILLHSITPVSRKHYDGEGLNRRQSTMNPRLRRLAAEQGIEYFDLAAVLAAEDGWLREDLTPEGLHFHTMAYELWARESAPFVQRAVEQGLVPHLEGVEMPPDIAVRRQSLDQFDRENTAFGDSPPLVLLVGGTLMGQLDIAAHFPGLNAHNRAIPGEFITQFPGHERPGLLGAAHRVIHRARPRIIVLAMGEADLAIAAAADASDPEHPARAWRELVHDIRRHNPGARLIVHTLPSQGEGPAYRRCLAVLNPAIRRHARAEGLALVDLEVLMAGGLAGTPKGLAKWVAALAPLLQQDRTAEAGSD